MWDLAVNLAASAIAGVAVWLAQFLVRRRRLQRLRAFFGLRPDTECLFVVGRHVSSARPWSVHRDDVASLLELAGIVRECGARQRLVLHDEPLRGLGERTEFCLGGPVSNTRTAAHLRWLLPGVTVTIGPDGVAEDGGAGTPGRAGTPERTTGVSGGRTMSLRVGPETYHDPARRFHHLLIARVPGHGPAGCPVFLVCGQTATANHAGVRFLATEYPRLMRRYGAHGRFALVMRIVDPPVYGHHLLEPVADVTDHAFTTPGGGPVGTGDGPARTGDGPAGTGGGSAGTGITERDR